MLPLLLVQLRARTADGGFLATWFVCRHLLRQCIALMCAAALCFSVATAQINDSAVDFSKLEQRYADRIGPLLKQFCWECHDGEHLEGELDLARFSIVSRIRDDSGPWLKVIEMLDVREMPPRDAPQLTDAQRSELRKWLDDFLAAEANATAGDPGPVVLRRLNNAEYTITIEELTGQPLDPAREFPADSAAGEGFTNTGNSLVMSPALLDKYLAAAKHVAEHAVLLPEGIQFSKHTSRRDWTDEALKQIRDLYAKHTEASGSTPVVHVCCSRA